MAEEQLMGYGYSSDDVKPFNLHFGLNNNTFLKKFEFNPNAGKDNTAGEAIDLSFDIAGTERNLRLFPVDPDKVYDKERKLITDKKSTEYVKAYNDTVKSLGAMITHVLHCFSDDQEGIKAALSKPFASFKQYALQAKALLPANFSQQELDIFLQYQWNVSQGKNTTYLEIPRAMKHGRWLCRHIEPVGTWKEERYEEQNSGEPEKALRYVDDAGNKHPFTKSAWFMSNKFARRTNADGETIEPSTQEEEQDEAGAAAMNQGTNGTPEATAQTPEAGQEESNW